LYDTARDSFIQHRWQCALWIGHLSHHSNLQFLDDGVGDDGLGSCRDTRWHALEVRLGEVSTTVVPRPLRPLSLGLRSRVGSDLRQDGANCHRLC
jgi:hypothetical protein